MPDIRYVCLSDMHLGEEDSLLTNLKEASTDIDYFTPSPVMVKLVDCLRHLISRNEHPGKPTLILNGDILEMALCYTNQAAMVFERFIELVMPPGDELFERIFYIPGNHDHHIWELARETQYVDFLKEKNPGQYLPIPWNTTNMFVENAPDCPQSFFLTRLLKRYDHLGKMNGNEGFKVMIAYPNFGLFKEAGQKCVVFHHGHFVESIYHLISNFRNMLFHGRAKPEDIWHLEGENFAWIDFFWSTLGRSRGTGEDIELIYEKMQNKEQMKKLTRNFAQSLSKMVDLPGWWTDAMEAKLLGWGFNYLADKFGSTERTKTEKDLSDNAREGLFKYIETPLKKQMLVERQGNMPIDVAFVFGHTHKPFEKDVEFKGYPQWVNVYNTGGWVVETVDREVKHGGAVVLVDEDLNTLSVRMYNEAGTEGPYKVSVKESTHAGEENSPFFRRITELVRPGEEPWLGFSSAAFETVRERADNLRKRTEKNI